MTSLPEIAQKKDWYFFYNSHGFVKKDINKLSKNLESLGFEYEKCTGLGGGIPGTEQFILWLHSHQFISGILTGVLSNYLTLLLKKLYQWFKNTPHKNNIIPVVQFFITFRDSKSERLTATISFRFDKPLEATEVNRSLLDQAKYLDTSSESEEQCSKCNNTINPGEVYYIATKKANYMEPICIFCKDNKQRIKI